jgi:glutamate synthase domain-containing protein 1
MANEFINHATNTIKEVAKTMQERGNQYADTWGEDGCWHLTKAIVEKFTEKKLTQQELKSIALACFCDQKYSRFAGGYKKDTAVDLIPYLSALVDTLQD